MHHVRGRPARPVVDEQVEGGRRAVVVEQVRPDIIDGHVAAEAELTRTRCQGLEHVAPRQRANPES